MNRRLIDKSYFTKVEALEMFTNFWSYGLLKKKGFKDRPKHNVYTPPQMDIMPRPKFFRHNGEDVEGTDYSYRGKNFENVSPI